MAMFICAYSTFTLKFAGHSACQITDIHSNQLINSSTHQLINSLPINSSSHQPILQLYSYIAL